jgi:signal transduction histidine kinase
VVSALRSYLSPEQADAEAIVEVDRDLLRVLTLMHNMLKHGITVTTELEPVRVIGSSDRLSQVWMNLIRNAAQAMEYSGALLIRAVKSEGRVIVSVIDSGPGVPLEIRDKIFQPFFTTKKQGEGLGLGLDICRKIVESARGSITLESRPGRTEFRVNLPAAPEPMGEREAKNG